MKEDIRIKGHLMDGERRKNKSVQVPSDVHTLGMEQRHAAVDRAWISHRSQLKNASRQHVSIDSDAQRLCIKEFSFYGNPDGVNLTYAMATSHVSHIVSPPENADAVASSVPPIPVLSGYPRPPLPPEQYRHALASIPVSMTRALIGSSFYSIPPSRVSPPPYVLALNTSAGSPPPSVITKLRRFSLPRLA